MDGYADGRARLAKMDEQMAQLEHKARNLPLSDDWWNQAASIKAFRNAMVGFLQLPIEILIRIAVPLVQDSLPDAPEDLYSLTHTCTHLRTLYVNTPELWAHLNTSWGEQELKASTDRSEDYSLHLEISTADVAVLKSEWLIPARTAHIMLHDEYIYAVDEERPAMRQIRQFMDLLKGTDMPRLCTVVLQDPSATSWKLGTDVLNPSSCAVSDYTEARWCARRPATGAPCAADARDEILRS